MKKQERTFGETVRRFSEPYFKNKTIAIRSVVMYLVWISPAIIHIFFIQKLVLLLELGDRENFIFFAILYGLYNIFHEILEYIVRKWGWVESVNEYRKTIHKQYIGEFVKLDNTQTEKMGTGKLIALMDKGMDVWSLSLDHVVMNFVQTLVVFIFALVMILNVNFFYGLLFLILYVIVHILGVILNKKSLSYRRKRLDVWNEYVRKVVRIIMNKYETLQTGKINAEIESLDESAGELYRHTYKMADYIHWFFRLGEGLLAWIKFGVVVVLGFQILDGTITISVLVGIFGILTLMDHAINKSMTFFKDFTKSFTTIEKMWDFFDNTPDIKGYESGKEFEYNKGKIEIEKLSFGYTKKQKVFDNFSLDIAGAKITALVGNSGSGKSTLVKLISGYIRQDSGKIKVDGQNLEKVSLKSYYKNIGYLTQEPSVFDGTIKDNLTYAVDRTLKSGELEKVIKQAKCEFIYDLESGLETEIGEKGIRLSGGQRQRLAIAKIFLKNPKIIILDEPTSALDSFSEEQITKAMHNLLKGRTVIIIAHRLQTVKNADKILVLEDGKVVEKGNHKELVKQKGIYKKMLDLQSGF